MNVRSLIVAAAASGSFASLAGAAPVQYLCDDKAQLSVTFHSEPAVVELVFEGTEKRLTLPQVLSADGGRYAAGDVEFWIKGNQATLTQGSKKTTCEH